MKNVDEKMLQCPLKHEIRCNLWERFARKIGRKDLSYLTLFSPPMMDIKLLNHRGLLDFADGHYRSVAAVTTDDDAYQEALTGGRGRPEFLAKADVDELLLRPNACVSRADAKKFSKMWPFDVINLDYCNSLQQPKQINEISDHLEALCEVLKRQKKCGASRFALFVTSLAEKTEVAKGLQSEMERRIDENVASNPEFKNRFVKAFGEIKAKKLKTDNYEEFIPLGMIKFIGNLISDVGYEIKDCTTASILRDTARNKEHRHLILHTAFEIQTPIPIKDLGNLGRQQHRERRVSRYLYYRGKGEIIHLSERKNKTELMQIHCNEINNLNSDTFELDIPEPS